MKIKSFYKDAPSIIKQIINQKFIVGNYRKVNEYYGKPVSSMILDGEKMSTSIAMINSGINSKNITISEYDICTFKKMCRRIKKNKYGIDLRYGDISKIFGSTITSTKKFNHGFFDFTCTISDKTDELIESFVEKCDSMAILSVTLCSRKKDVGKKGTVARVKKILADIGIKTKKNIQIKHIISYVKDKKKKNGRIEKRGTPMVYFDIYIGNDWGEIETFDGKIDDITDTF